MQQVTNLLPQLPRAFIIVGDLNARNQMSRDTERNSHGVLIEDLLANSSLCILNNGQVTHVYKQTERESCAEMTMVS